MSCKRKISFIDQEFDSMKSFAEYFGVNHNRVKRLIIDRKLTPEQCIGFEYSRKKFTKEPFWEYNNHVFESKYDFANFWGLEYGQVKYLLNKKKLTPEQCIGLTSSNTRSRSMSWEHQGVRIKNRGEFAKFFGLSESKLKTLISMYKLTYEECLGLEKCDKYYPKFEKPEHIKSQEKSGEKRCSKCKQTKSLSNFKTRKGRKYNNYHSWCDDCLKADYFEKKYGLSKEDHEKLFEHQDNKCAICGVEGGDERALFVDHDHGSGDVRGLLCLNCNAGIGHFKDSPTLLRKAIKYLK